jgi:hypothetical protein
MIEEALRRQLEPIADRRRRLHVAWRLAICWFICGVIGLGLLLVTWLWGWRSSPAVGALCVSAAVATVWIIYRSRRLRPDYRALARSIEQQHPELKALLLAAIEQEPRPDGQFGYLQRQVIIEAVKHAMGHDWLQSVSTARLTLAGLSWVAALVFLSIVLSQIMPSTSAPRRGVLVGRGYEVTVSPGNAEVERGSPVVVLARFAGQVPASADLSLGPAGQEPQRMALTRSLDDPVFGGIIQDVQSDLVYHVEYAGRRTEDYRLSVYQCPEVIRADARIVYPSYTKLPEKFVKDTRQINVVEGSKVTLFFTLNKPVATARLVPRSGIALGLDIDSADPNVLVTSLTAAASQRYELQVADAQGRSNKMPPRFAIDVQKNLPPELTPTFPGGDAVVSPLEELSLEAKVSDDYGLTGYGLSYALAGADGCDVTLSPSEPNANAAQPQIQYTLAMEQLDAQPDQLLTYYFWADDIGPDGKPRRTTSDIYFAEVRPFEEIFRESQSFQDRQNQDQQNNQNGQSRGQQAEQLARLQKQIITATWNIKQQADLSGGIGDRTEDLEVVRQSQAQALDQAREALSQAEDSAAGKSLEAAAGHMETAVDHLTKASDTASSPELTPALGAEQSAYQELLRLRDREHQVAMGRNSNRANANSEQFQRQLQQLQLTQRENRYETQRLARSEQNGQREDLQALNRLRDLARRQGEMANRLREAQAALREAQTEQQRQEALRELRRLRDEQLEALRDMDELQQQMESPQNRQRMADAGQRLDDTRAGIRESTEALEQGMVSRAITSASRAQRQLEEMRDEFQRRTSSQFTDQMRQMREQAQQLDQQQREIGQNIGRRVEERQKTLEGTDANRELSDRIEQQRQDLERLTEQMKEVSGQAETSEPLLSQTLYDTLRRASTENLDRSLEVTGELLKRDLLPQAQELEQRAGDGIEQIRQGVEEAARSVLGDEADSLRLARQQLDELIRQVSDANAGAGPAQTGDSNARAGGLRAGDPNTRTGSLRAGDSNARAGSSPTGDPNALAGLLRAGDPNAARESGNPFGGGGFGRWSDGLRDVEEMLPAQELRDEAARVRDRARTLQAEFRRHGTEPQWDLVRAQITDPLTELRRQVDERLAQLQSDKTMAPIDRDPVPDRFAELVRAYFESLGEDKP